MCLRGVLLAIILTAAAACSSNDSCSYFGEATESLATSPVYVSSPTAVTDFFSGTASSYHPTVADTPNVATAFGDAYSTLTSVFQETATVRQLPSSLVQMSLPMSEQLSLSPIQHTSSPEAQAYSEYISLSITQVLFSMLQQTPSTVVQQTPSSVVQQAPSSVVQQTPSSVVQQAPSSVVQQAPSSVVQQAPSSVVQQAPSSVVQQTPSSVVQQTPSSVVQQTPSSVVQQTPSSVVQQALPLSSPTQYQNTRISSDVSTSLPQINTPISTPQLTPQMASLPLTPSSSFSTTKTSVVRHPSSSLDKPYFSFTTTASQRLTTMLAQTIAMTPQSASLQPLQTTTQWTTAASSSMLSVSPPSPSPPPTHSILVVLSLLPPVQIPLNQKRQAVANVTCQLSKFLKVPYRNITGVTLGSVSGRTSRQAVFTFSTVSFVVTVNISNNTVTKLANVTFTIAGRHVVVADVSISLFNPVAKPVVHGLDPAIVVGIVVGSVGGVLLLVVIITGIGCYVWKEHTLRTYRIEVAESIPEDSSKMAEYKKEAAIENDYQFMDPSNSKMESYSIQTTV